MTRSVSGLSKGTDYATARWRTPLRYETLALPFPLPAVQETLNDVPERLDRLGTSDGDPLHHAIRARLSQKEGRRPRIPATVPSSTSCWTLVAYLPSTKQ